MPSIPSQATEKPSKSAAAPNGIKQDRVDEDAIERALQQMQNLTAADPYFLTIEQNRDQEYRFQSRGHAEQWLSHTPFERTERYNIQYQTFVFHEPGKDMYMQHSSGHLTPIAIGHDVKSRSVQPIANAANGAIKKISLDAYKKKQNGVNVTNETSRRDGKDSAHDHAPSDGAARKVKAETQEMLAAVGEIEDPLSHGNEDGSEVKKNLKRKRESNDLAEPTQHPAGNIDRSRQSGHELSKLSTARSKESTVRGQVKTNADASPVKSPLRSSDRPHALPPKLSPLGSPEMSYFTNHSTDAASTTMPDLPPRLSPTIPDNIAKALNSKSLARSSLQSSKQSSVSGSVSKDGHLTPVKMANVIIKHMSPTPRNGFRANSSSPAVRSDADDHDRPNHTAHSRHVKAPTVSSEDDEVKPDKSRTKPVPPSLPEKVAQGAPLVVKLKYGRSRINDVKRILKMPSRHLLGRTGHNSPRSTDKAPKQSSDVAARQIGEKKPAGNVKGVAQKVGPVKKFSESSNRDEKSERVAEKRSLPDGEQTASTAKRQRMDVQEAKHPPSTPVQLDTPTPTQPPSTLKSQLLNTPGTRKDLLSVAMNRDRSHDSSNYASPAIPETPSMTSTGTSQNPDNHRPTSSDSRRTPEQRAWEAAQKRFEQLGRELKHASTNILHTAKNPPSKGPSRATLEKLGAAHAIESFLCYLLAFTCMDEAGKAPSCRTWATLTPFFTGFVRRNAGTGAARGGPLAGLAGALAVVACKRITDLTALHPADGLDRDDLLVTLDALRKAAADADAWLGVDVVLARFPAAWDHAAKRVLPEERLDPARLGGAYRLPIGVGASPVSAARAGYAMLREWVESEELDYSLKLKL